MSTTHNVPQGDLVLRTLAMPADTNANGDKKINGGELERPLFLVGDRVHHYKTLLVFEFTTYDVAHAP